MDTPQERLLEHTMNEIDEATNRLLEDLGPVVVNHLENLKIEGNDVRTRMEHRSKVQARLADFTVALLSQWDELEEQLEG